MSEYEVSFKDGKTIITLTVAASDREAAQEIAIDTWESAGVAHGELKIVRK